MSFVFAGVNTSMNPFLASEVGFPTREAVLPEAGHPTKEDEEGIMTCARNYTFAQWLWQPYATPRIFYLNGNGIEAMLLHGDDFLLNSTVSDRLEYFSTQSQFNTYCGYGVNPISQTLIETLLAYKHMYDRAPVKPLLAAKWKWW